MGKIRLTLDYIRLPDDSDARPLFPMQVARRINATVFWRRVKAGWNHSKRVADE